MAKKIIEGRITSRFGGRNHPLDGIYKEHNGVDIAAEIGTEIFSPCNGIVSAVYTHLQGGLTLILRSECGELRFGMCHLKSVELEVGAEVHKGDLVAHSGNSGRSTGAHLHYSVKKGGRWRGEQYVGGSFVDSEPYIEIE